MVMAQDSQRRWTFFTNHGHVLIYLSRHPDARVRDIADTIGITHHKVDFTIGLKRLER